jgi:molybdopterin-containing oxidoreductase family iron-sulfur binding subunit
MAESSLRQNRFPQLKIEYATMACQHCEKPPCVDVCPVNATYKDENGTVVISYDACVGCRECVGACPYQARVFNEEPPHRAPDFNYGDAEVVVRPVQVVEKCTFCHERVSKGAEPMCVTVCPAQARTFGDLNDPQSSIAMLLKKRKFKRLLEKEQTGPQTYYLV